MPYRTLTGRTFTVPNIYGTPSRTQINKTIKRKLGPQISDMFGEKYSGFFNPFVPYTKKTYRSSPLNPLARSPISRGNAPSSSRPTMVGGGIKLGFGGGVGMGIPTGAKMGLRAPTPGQPITPVGIQIGMRAPTVQGTFGNPFHKSGLSFGEAQLQPWQAMAPQIPKDFGETLGGTIKGIKEVVGAVSRAKDLITNPQKLATTAISNALTGVKNWMLAPQTYTYQTPTKNVEETQSNLGRLSSLLGQKTTSIQYKDAAGNVISSQTKIDPNLFNIMGKGATNAFNFIATPFGYKPPPPNRIVTGPGAWESSKAMVQAHPGWTEAFKTGINLGVAVGTQGSSLGIPGIGAIGDIGSKFLVGTPGFIKWGATPREQIDQGKLVYSQDAGQMVFRREVESTTPFARFANWFAPKALEFPVVKATSEKLTGFKTQREYEMARLKSIVEQEKAQKAQQQLAADARYRAAQNQAYGQPPAKYTGPYAKWATAAPQHWKSGPGTVGTVSTSTGKFVPGVSPTNIRGGARALAEANIARANVDAAQTALGSGALAAFHKGTLTPVRTGYKSIDQSLAGQKITDPLRVGGGAPISAAQKVIDADQAAYQARIAADPSQGLGWDQYNYNASQMDQSSITEGMGGYHTKFNVPGMRVKIDRGFTPGSLLASAGFGAKTAATNLFEGQVEQMNKMAAQRAMMLEGLSISQVRKKDTEVLPWARPGGGVRQHKTRKGPDYKMSGPSRAYKTGSIRTSEGEFQIENPSKNKVFSSAKKKAA